MQVIIQTITITWSKASRGGELAALRALIPKQLLVPHHSKLSGSFCHTLAYSEENRFAAQLRDEFKRISLPFQFASTEIDYSGDTAILTYRYKNGAPARTYHDNTGTLAPVQHSLRVPANSWAFLEYNSRRSDSDTGKWWYEHIIINIAVGPQIDPANPFINEPTDCFSLVSQLW
jgi:hypothetical protein